MKITFFGTQPYDRESFDRANASCGFEFNYHRSHLNGNNALLAQGADAVCIFVNDTADAGTIRQLSASAEAFFQALAKPAIIGLIYVKFPKFQFLLIYDNISKHNLLNSSLQIWYCI